nr:disease resistance protein rga2 [Quercus suber]
MEKDVAILNALEPPPRLEFLLIGCIYKGTTLYPNWMMSKLTYLKRLIIGECPNLEQLPPLGKLQLLEELEIRKAPMIQKCGNLKCLPNYLLNTPLQLLDIYGCPILERRCERRIGDYWPSISHIPNIMINFRYVQRDGQLPYSIDLEMHDDVVEDSNHEEDDDRLESMFETEATTDYDDDLHPR